MWTGSSEGLPACSACTLCEFVQPLTPSWQDCTAECFFTALHLSVCMQVLPEVPSTSSLAEHLVVPSNSADSAALLDTWMYPFFSLGDL